MELDVLSGISVEAETGEAGIELDLSLDPDSTADEAEAIAAIAQAIEEEANAENPRTPEPADIRSLLLRVEALAKKAEAMRMAQDLPVDSEQAPEGEAETDSAEGSGEDEQKQAGAAA